ncbi:MAG TPA: adenylate/guanylate cyclase domain-containing protein [Gemmatimonadota bacterium]|nr:adenylate/guanylate cyclase domain-containing protein [Gemmatimonadota bacterium]
MRALPHRLAAVWFADIVGYGRLSSRNENEALQLVGVFQRTCRDIVHRHEGRLVKFTGDGALAEFPSTEAAVRAACALEPTFRARAKAAQLPPPHLHVGLHVGEIATGPDGDLYGEGLNLAARLEALSGPGEILVSEDVQRQLHHRPEFRFIPQGERTIPDSEEPVSLFSVVESPDAAAAALPPAASGPWRELHRELVRRRVYTTVATYVVAVALGLVAAALLLGRLGGPEWVLPGLALAAVLAIPAVGLLAWTFEIGRGGLRRYGRVFEEPGAVARARVAFAGLALAAVALAGGISLVSPPGMGELPGLPANRVAVLYFEDSSPGRNLGYLADGLTEALIRELSGVRDLEVVSRNGVRPFRHASVHADSMARALNAGTLVQGSVSESAGRLRVNVELVDGQSGTVLAAATVERPRGELFDLQDDLAEQVSNLLRRELGEEIRLAEMRAGTESVAAWELVQRAAELREQATPLVEIGNLEEAGRMYDRADSLMAEAQAADTTWVEPLLQRGWLAHDRLEWFESSDPGGEFLRWLETGFRHAEAALRVSPRDPDALELRGRFHLKSALFAPAQDPRYADSQLLAAEEDLRAAIEANPEQAGAWRTLSIPLAARGETQAAKLAAERAYQADAYLEEADDILWRLFAHSYDLNQPAEAERWCREGIRRFPEDSHFVQCQLWLMTLPGVPADADRAWSLLDEYNRLAPPQEVFRRKWNETALAAVLARAGLADSAIAVAVRARADETIDPGRSVLYTEAFVRVLAGQEDEVVGLLGSYLAASPGQRREVANTWWFEDLRDRPDFQALVAEDSRGPEP